MRVLVLGGGVIGVSAAYYLTQAGHQVELIERREAAAMETSFANAGEVSPGYSAPWAGPGVPIKAIRWLLMRYSPLVIWPLLDPAMWRWGVMMLANCTARAYALNKSRMVPIAEYSRDCMKLLRAATGIAYDERAQGTLQLFRTQKQLDDTAKDIEVLKQYGVPYEVLDRAGFLHVEPGLKGTQEKFIGALRLPGDETGDCHLFTQRLGAMAAARGATLRFDTTILGVERAGDRLTGVRTTAGTLVADAVVMALGSYTPLMLKTLKLRIPVYPVKGYSITLPIVDASRAPESTIMDETPKVAVTR
ncbi:MAG TPA: D-amino acid dehydrogenase, partial [Burkholderiaceae bacterium]|nr:D-amino acid dehydrogenase [Burkholderiaceae bacterium]